LAQAVLAQAQAILIQGLVLPIYTCSA